ncbi:MAG: malate dehydrogenase (quinone) [Pseudomonadota bacterium]
MGSNAVDRIDVALVGGGIMSATLGVLLKALMPDLRIHVFERLHRVAFESSQSMNNAGTGHAGNCELNYTPRAANGTVDIAKALHVNEAYEVSMQLWARLVETGELPDASSFFNPLPHLSFVWGDDHVRFLRARHAAMRRHPMFADMVFTEDRDVLAEWMPLIMDGRDHRSAVAATRVGRGTDVDFGRLTQALFGAMEGHAGFELHLKHEVENLWRDPGGGWRVVARDTERCETREVQASFVFLGAGGAALPLLQASGIPEVRGYGGFPVSGQWLICTDRDVAERHRAKVYGMAALGAPPMSVPHLDTRYWKGRPALLFGPFAGFTTKYLLRGSYLDLFASLRPHNVGPMLDVAADNMDLTRYLIGQAVQSQGSRMIALREYMPTARSEHWKFALAGQRVQIIKRGPTGRGKLEFGTEVVTAADGSLAALLGASPGASTGAATMLELIHRCFPKRAANADFQANLRRAIPSWGHDLARDPGALGAVRDRVDTILGLPGPSRGRLQSLLS